MTKPDPPADSANRPERLEGWKAIAEHFNVAERTVRNWGREKGLPVHRHLSDDKSRVWAYSAEVDAWQAQRSTTAQRQFESSQDALGFSALGDHPDLADSAQCSGSVNFESADLTGVASPAGGGLSTDSKLRPSQVEAFDGGIRPNRDPRPIRWSAAILLLVVASFIGGTFALGRRWLAPPVNHRLSRIRIQADTLFALDEQGQELWRHSFPDGLAQYSNDEDELSRQHLVIDLLGDGQKDLVFVQRLPPPTRGSRLVCFRGGKVARTIEPGRAVVVGPDQIRDRYTRPYGIQQLLAIPGKPFPKIAVTSLHHIDAPSQVLILDHNFNIAGEYWHPGHLNFMRLGDIEHDGKVELILSGVNNRNHCATVVALDPGDVGGTTRPIFDRRAPDDNVFALLKFGDDGQHLQDFVVGTEKYVLLFPRSDLMFEGGNSLWPYNRVTHVPLAPERLPVIVAENKSMSASEQITYDLDWSLNVFSVTTSAEFQKMHSERFAHGSLDHAFTEHELDRLAKNVIVVRYR